jgi:hypothetical protein
MVHTETGSIAGGETVTTRGSTQVDTIRKLSFLDSAGGHILVGFSLFLLAIGIFILVDQVHPKAEIEGAVTMLAGSIGTIAVGVFSGTKKAIDDQ